MIVGFIHPNPTTFDYHRRQYFSLPFGIISYITQNPITANGLLKLQKTCKYFFSKNKIIVVNYDKWIEYNENYLFYIIHRIGWKQVQKFYFKDFKYWLASGFDVGDKYSLKISTCIYRCSLQSLIIYKQDLTLNEMDFLLNGKKMTLLCLMRVNFFDDKNGELVSFDQILSKVPNIMSFTYFSEKEIFSTETFDKMNSLQFNSKINHFDLIIYNLIPDANVVLLCDFIQKNVDSQNADVYILFKMENADHKIILQTAVDKKFQDWKYKPHILVMQD